MPLADLPDREDDGTYRGNAELPATGSGLACPVSILPIAKCRERRETPRIHLASWDLCDRGARSSSATAASDDYDRWELSGGIWSLGRRSC
jgi:hypothetical protein